METTFFSATSQMAVLFFFMAIGYGMRKKNMVDASAGKTLSALEVYLFLPCLNILNFSKSCTPAALADKLSLLLTALVLLAFLLPFAYFVAKRLAHTPMERDVYTYSLCFSNSGYVGYPVVGAVFGDEALFNMMIFCIPLNLAIYTLGMYILNPNKKFSWRRLFNPATLSPFLGIALGLLNLSLPAVATTVLTMGSNCMAPVAMLLTGMVLGAHPAKQMFLNARAYIASVFRLILIPLTATAVMLLLGLRNDFLLVAASTLAMPMGLNSVVFPETFGGDSTAGAQATFISNLMGLLTIPLVLAFISHLTLG
ncbi:MAG: AEC family transporter [Clostridia bacterium]